MTDTELARRVERLERDNRRLKRLGAAALVLAAAMGAIYATRPVPQKITAREFDAVDASGKVRVTLGTLQGVAGEPTLTLTGQNRQTLLEAPGLVMLISNSHEGASAITIGASHGLPGIMLADGQGFEMDLGSAKTVAPKTGATQQTSAASIVMFGNDKKHHIIWSAP